MQHTTPKMSLVYSVGPALSDHYLFAPCDSREMTAELSLCSAGPSAVEDIS